MQPHLKSTINALFLAAGFGTRLKKIGETTPKGLFKNSQGLSITDLMVKAVTDCPQVQRLALVSNNRFAQQYQDHLHNKYPEHKIALVNDGVNNPQERLGSLGDLMLALNQLNWWDKPLLVLPSDRTPENILPKLINLHQKQPSALITCVSQDTKERIAGRFGCAQLNTNNQIVNFQEKPTQPKSNYRALAFYLFSPQALQMLKSYQDEGQNMDSPGNIIPWLLKNDFPVHACISNKDSLDIGNLQELEEFQEHYFNPVD